MSHKFIGKKSIDFRERIHFTNSKNVNVLTVGNIEISDTSFLIIQSATHKTSSRFLMYSHQLTESTTFTLSTHTLFRIKSTKNPKA